MIRIQKREKENDLIEYIPAENAWVPIEADGYMYIDCLWVSGSFKGHGYSTDLLGACIEDSKKKGSKSFKKYFKINKTTGKVTLKKGLKKGTYKVKVKVQAIGNNNYKASAVKTVTFKVKIK